VGDKATRWLFAGTFPIAAAIAVIVLAVVTRRGGPSDASLSELLAFVASSGFGAMVLIETAKRLLPLRAAYNRRQVAAWLEERNPGRGTVAMGQLVQAMLLVSPKPADGDGSAREQTWEVDLQLGRSWSSAWADGSGVSGPFNLPAELLTAQVAAAAERALQSPRRYEELLEGLAPFRSLTSKTKGSWADERISAPDAGWLISSAIDQLQIRLAGRWQHYLQATACWLAGAVGLVISSTDAIHGNQGRVHVIAALVFGGFLAWVFRDAVAALERLRR
jgi:hypothetical protein